MATTNSISYDVLKQFRDLVFAKIRDVEKASSGAKYLTQLKEFVGRERWEASLRSAQQLRASRVITSPLLDDLDAQDVTDLRAIVERRYDQLVAGKGQKQQLLAALDDIAWFRNGVAHPAFFEVTVENARRLAERVMSASIIIFGEHSEQMQIITGVTAGLYDYVPPPMKPLIKALPARHEVVGHFIGRERELRTLYSWLDSTIQLWILEGDGGKGKSSLAYVFCESLGRANASLERVIWISAKKWKYSDGTVHGLQADFWDLPSAFEALIASYGFGDNAAANFDELEKLTIDLLVMSPALIVLDDVDSLDRENEDVHYWFTHTIARVAPTSRVLLTTRRGLYGLGAYTTQIRGLSFDETKRLLRNASEKYYANPDKLAAGNLTRLAHEATEGSPLYLEDLIRLILITGKQPDAVIAEWRLARHDAREYALKREFELLSSDSKRVLVAAALADGAVSRQELLSTCGCSESALEASIDELQRFFLISQPEISALTPTFEVNRNLGVLVKHVMSKTEDFKRIANALRQIRSTGAKPHRVAKDAQRAIREAVSLVSTDRHSDAENILKEFLNKYPDEGALLSHLGWVLSRWPDGKRQTEAESYMQRAVNVRHKNKATYANLGLLYLNSEQYENASRVAAAGLELYPDNRDLNYMHAYSSAKVALQQAEGIDFISLLSLPSVLEPLQRAVRAIMSLKTMYEESGEGAIYDVQTKALSAIDARLRSEIDRCRRIAT